MERPTLRPIDSQHSDKDEPGSFWEDVTDTPSSMKTPRIHHSSQTSFPNLTFTDSISAESEQSSALRSPTTSLEQRLRVAQEAKQGDEILFSATRTRSKSVDADLFMNFKGDLQNEITFLRTQVSRAQNLLHAAGVTGQRLKNENKELRRQMATEIRSDSRATEQLERRISRLEESNTRLKAELERKEKHIQELQHEKSILKHDMEIGRTDGEDRERHAAREIDQLTTEISRVRTDSSHVQNEYKLKMEHLQHELSSFSTRNNLLASDNAKLAEEKERLAGELQFVVHKNKMMEREMAKTSHVLLDVNRRVSSPAVDISMDRETIKRPALQHHQSSPPEDILGPMTPRRRGASPRGGRERTDAFLVNGPGSQRRASTSQLAGNTRDLLKEQQTKIAGLEDDLRDLKELNAAYDEKFTDVLWSVDDLIMRNARIDFRNELRGISETIRKHVGMEEIIAPPVGQTPPPEEQPGVESGVPSEEDMFESKMADEVAGDVASLPRLSRLPSALLMDERMFLEGANFEMRKGIVRNFLSIYSREESWKCSVEISSGVNHYTLILTSDEDDPKVVHVRMSFLYPLIVLLGQTIGIQRRCITYAFVLMLYPVTTQVGWMSSVFGEMQRTLEHHDDDKLWSFVYGILHFMFTTYQHVKPFVGSQTVLPA